MAREFRYDDVPAIEVTGGKIRGYYCDGAYIFKGVPYAQAKRFQMPEEVTPWEGVRETASYGFVCPLMGVDTPSAELMVPHRYWPQDENCQNLNIWTKDLDPQAKRPVLVWLHGGGYAAGSSIEQAAYDGYNMCMKGDVVAVSVNHRLNILGYLDLSPFGEKYANSGNAGHADLVAALQWIHENIVSFGGDPENVTIFGQSGGGMKVADLMQIPAADGLFQKGLVMSGVNDGTLLPCGQGDGREIVSAMLSELGLTEEDVEKLETLPYYDLVRAYGKASPAIAKKGRYVGGIPMANEYYLGMPLEVGWRTHAGELPLMVGSVFGEFSFLPLDYDKTALTEQEIRAVVGKVYGEHTEEMIAEFGRAYPGKNPVDLLSLDRVMRQPSKRLAGMHAGLGGAGTYLYNFTLEFPYQHGKIAWHCADIPFFFHNADKVEVCAIPGVSEVLEEQIFGALMAFARTGNPNHAGLPQWEPVTKEEEPTMIFDRACEVRRHYDDELYRRMDALLPPFNLAAMMEEQDVQH